MKFGTCIITLTFEQAKKAQKESRGIDLHFKLSDRWGGGGVNATLDCFTSGKESGYPFYIRLGGFQGRSGYVRNILV